MDAKNFYRGDLPHFHPNDCPYFLTFRIAGSEPKDDELLANLLSKGDFLEYDRILDNLKAGPHWLRDRRVAPIVKEAFHHRDATEYDLYAYTIMSNHVHMVISLLGSKRLDQILQAMKSYTATQCNKVLKRKGEFWKHQGGTTMLSGRAALVPVLLMC